MPVEAWRPRGKRGPQSRGLGFRTAPEGPDSLGATGAEIKDIASLRKRVPMRMLGPHQ